MVTFDNNSYLVISKEKINTLELYIAAIADPLPEFKLLDMCEDSNDQLEGCLYTGEDGHKFLRESEQEIREEMTKILSR
jgi:hypothetical protein